MADVASEAGKQVQGGQVLYSLGHDAQAKGVTELHLDRYANPDALAKIVLHHGVGTNGRQMTLIAGAPLAKLGYETVALDNLGYGMTETAAGTTWSYDAWVQVTLDFLLAEKQRDPRPVFLYGLSAGGMLGYRWRRRHRRGYSPASSE